ncbi:MAG TPA: ABC transporter permease, partial [Anaerolineales bacterium]|nr:ABC transporter permease [Anaerolineales bacterium]
VCSTRASASKRKSMRAGRFFTRKLNLLALFLLAIYAGIALAAPTLAPPEEGSGDMPFQRLTEVKNFQPQPPGRTALMGTVATQARSYHLDVFYTFVWGARSAFKFGLTAALGAALLGMLIGGFGAFISGWVQSLVLHITDAFLAFPLIVGVALFNQLFLISQRLSSVQTITINGVSQSTGTPPPLQVFFTQVNPVWLALVLFSWMPTARLVNTLVMTVRQTDYVIAAHATGVGWLRILLRHILPNTIAPIVVLLTANIGGMVLIQATLTFIGMGGESAWGEILAQGRHWIIGSGGNPLMYWWVFVPITLALVVFGIAWNILGDGLNDWLNPRQTEHAGT